MQALDAGVAQLVEHQPSKLRVVGSSLIARSKEEDFFLFFSITRILKCFKYNDAANKTAADVAQG